MKVGFISLVGLVILGLALWLGSVQLDGQEVDGYTGNVGEMVAGVTIGQTIVGERDNLSSVSVMFATYSGRANTGQVRLTLRRLDNLSEIVREALVSVDEVGDNQQYQFSFEPVATAKDVTFLFMVEAPEGKAGQTVTVDIDNRDPYHFGSAYIMKRAMDDVTSAGLAAGGKPHIDVAFGTTYRVPGYVAINSWSRQTVRYFRDTWQDTRATYGLWGKVALQAVLLIAISLAVTVRTGRTRGLVLRGGTMGWLIILLVLAVIARILYAIELPLTNDEGNYLYDAATLLKGKLAGGDGYVKAPLVVLWIALWEWIGGNKIIVGRLSSVVIGALTIWPIYIIGRELWSKKTGTAAAALWALSGVTIVFNIYIHTQPLATWFAVSGIAALLVAVRHVGSGQRRMEKAEKIKGMLWLIGAGALLGLGVVSRKSVLALGLVPLFVVSIGIKTVRQKLQSLLLIGSGFVIVVVLFLGVATLIYGQEGFWEAAGFNSAEDGMNAVEESELEQVRAYSIRGMTPFFRESLPLIMLAVLGLGLAGERLIAKWLVRVEWLHNGARWRLNAWQKLAWIIPLLVYSWAWSFFKEYEGSSLMLFGMEWVWWGMLAVIVLMAAWPSGLIVKKAENTTAEIKGAELGAQETIGEEDNNGAKISGEGADDGGEASGAGMDLIGWVLPVVWIGGLIFFYQNWIKFHANYLGEFLPPLVIIGGVAIPEVWRRLGQGQVSHNKLINKTGQAVLAIGFVLVLSWSMFVSNYMTFVHEHTGTFGLNSLQEAAAWATDNIPLSEPIFTGAAAVPFLSGHEVSLDIAHPRWYAYGFTREDTSRISTFLPAVEEMLQAYRDANWFLLEQQTGFSFLMEYQEIEAGLERDWQAVKGIENGSNTMTFYQRKTNH